MLVVARILHRQQAVLHQLGDLFDRLVDAPLGAKATDLHAVGGEHPQRLLGLVVGEGAQVRQLRRDQHDGHQQRDCAQGCQGGHCFQEPTRPGCAQKAAQGRVGMGWRGWSSFGPKEQSSRDYRQWPVLSQKRGAPKMRPCKLLDPTQSPITTPSRRGSAPPK